MFEPDKWWIFAAAIVGAAAALMGLLFVAVSVRMDILTSRRAAVTRAAEALLLLALPFVAGVLVLIPDQASRLLGFELLLTAVAFGATLLVLDRRALSQPAQKDHLALTLQAVSPNLTTTLGLVLTGGSLTIQWGGGFYWLMPTVLVSVIGGMLSAWLFLVESA